MMFIELFAPDGVLNSQQRREIGERFISEIMSEDFGPDSLIDGIRSFCQVVVHEPRTWVAGGRDADVEAAPRFLARVSVPGSWRKEMSEMLIQRVTSVLADYEDDPQRLYQQPHAWVQIVGIPEHSYGAFGKVMTSTDITRLMTAGYRESGDSAAAATNLPEGVGIDPICGMTASHWPMRRSPWSTQARPTRSAASNAAPSSRRTTASPSKRERPHDDRQHRPWEAAAVRFHSSFGRDFPRCSLRGGRPRGGGLSR